MPKKIIVIDDDVYLIEVLRLMLEKKANLVIDAQNGTAAIKYSKKNAPSHHSRC
jgi:CheY-like chemotaxis protein